MKEKLEEIVQNIVNDARDVWNSNLSEEAGIIGYVEQLEELFDSHADQFMLEWISVDNPPKNAGWYSGALNPKNHDKSDPTSSNEWRNMFGFTKVWFNPDAVGKWYMPDPHGNGQCPIGDRITHWSENPKVPDLL